MFVADSDTVSRLRDLHLLLMDKNSFLTEWACQGEFNRGYHVAMMKMAQLLEGILEGDDMEHIINNHLQ
jgi:hypothetical protein